VLTPLNTSFFLTLELRLLSIIRTNLAFAAVEAISYSKTVPFVTQKKAILVQLLMLLNFMQRMHFTALS
jgi:hypothetical protein